MKKMNAGFLALAAIVAGASAFTTKTHKDGPFHYGILGKSSSVYSVVDFTTGGLSCNSGSLPTCSFFYPTSGLSSINVGDPQITSPTPGTYN